MNIRFHAQLTPGRPAVHWQGRWTNFAELDAGIEGYARAAAAWGVREGDRLGLLGWNHPAHLHGLYAAERHGFVHVPLNHRLPPAVNASLLRDLGITHLAHTPGCAAAAQAIAAAHGSVQLHDVSEIEPAPLARAARLPARPDGETIMLLFTGGTTGTPKAAKITRRMFDANNADTVAAWGLTPDDSTVMATPMFHSGVNALATPLLSIGGRIAILESFKPAEYLALNAASGATILFSVPTMLNLLIQDPAFEDADFSGVRFAITGGSPCPGPVREAFTRRGVRFKMGYGLTEAGVNCFALTLDEAQAKPLAVGYPMPHLEAVVREPDGTPTPAGQVGELTLSGPQVCAGYWGRDEDTAHTLRTLNGRTWLWTGDLARVDEDGAYYISGRRKEMFISGGENVYPAEVERALADLPGIAECAVCGVPDERWGEVGLAAVVLKPGSSFSPDALRAALRERLAGYQVPKHFLNLPELPKTAAGKVAKNEIAAGFAAPPEVPR